MREVIEVMETIDKLRVPVNVCMNECAKDM